MTLFMVQKTVNMSFPADDGIQNVLGSGNEG